MKAIFLSDGDGTLKLVYSQQLVNKIKGIVDIDTDFLSSKDIKERPDDFKNIEFIFSTWGMPKFSEEEIEKYFPSLKCLFYAAGSVQYFVRPFIKKGVKVFSAWAANAVPVSEYVTAQIILANKGFYAGSRFMSKGQVDKARDSAFKYSGNYDTNVGIIGAGMIGRMVIERLKDYNVNLMVYDPFLSEESSIQLGVKKVSLNDIFSKCSVISNHVANNEHTKGMLNYSHFSLMQKYATFINTGRGAQVVEKDLIKVLEEREDITAILDVTNPEPPVEDSKFFSLDNCILTPHVAGSFGNEVHRMAEYMINEYLLYKEKKPCNYEVTEKMLETMA